MYVSRLLLIQTEAISLVRTPVSGQLGEVVVKGEEFGVKKYLCSRVRAPHWGTIRIPSIDR